MTIALGILCRDGVVIGADSQISVPGYLKYQESKVWHTDHPSGWALLFTYAGDVGMYYEARQHIISEFTSSDATPEALEFVCKRVFNRMGLRIPLYDGSRRMDLEMLWAISAQKFETRLLAFTGSALHWVKDYSLGSGGFVALSRWLSDALYNPNLSTDLGKLIAIYLVSKAKAYVDGCGGESVISILRSGEKAADIPRDQILALEAEMLAREKAGLRAIVGL